MNKNFQNSMRAVMINCDEYLLSSTIALVDIHTMHATRSNNRIRLILLLSHA